MNDSPLPKISVIVAVFNGVKTLQKCLNSIAQQSYPCIELIVIDGGSTDGTVDILRANQSHISYWISEPDKGIYNAWNKALPHATGEWICFLGADDFFWDVHVLKQMVAVLRALSPEVRVAYGQIMRVTVNGEHLNPVGRPWSEVKNQFKQVMSIPHQGTMHHCSLFQQYGGFDETFKIAGDYEFLLRELKTADACFVPDIILVGMRNTGISSAPDNAIKCLLEFRRAQRMHGDRFPGLLWLTRMARACVRRMVSVVLGEKRTRKMVDAARRLMGRSPVWTPR